MGCEAPAVDNIDDLIAAAANGGSYKLISDLSIPSDKTLEVAEGKTLNLNLNDKTLTVGASNFTVVAKATLNLSGGGTVKSTNNEDGSDCLDNYGTTTITNVSF